jgi:hypothetical protein
MPIEGTSLVPSNCTSLQQTAVWPRVPKVRDVVISFPGVEVGVQWRGL